MKKGRNLHGQNRRSKVAEVSRPIAVGGLPICAKFDKHRRVSPSVNSQRSPLREGTSVSSPSYLAAQADASDIMKNMKKPTAVALMLTDLRSCKAARLLCANA
jgi:hypothetical protein